LVEPQKKKKLVWRAGGESNLDGRRGVVLGEAARRKKAKGAGEDEKPFSQKNE